MRRRLIFSAIAGVLVAFLATVVAYEGTYPLLTKGDNYALHSDHHTLVVELDAFRVETGSYPRALPELNMRERSGAGGFPFRFDADGTPQDPWGTAYVYEQIGSSYKLKSLGSDGRKGGRGTAADIDFPPTASAAHRYIEPMTWFEFMRDHATLAVIGTSVLAGGCTFHVGAAGSFSRRRDEREPLTAFFVAIILAGVLSVFVGGFLAALHVPIGEHH